MSQTNQPKSNRLLIYGGLLAVIITAFVMTAPETPTRSGVSVAARKPSTNSKSVKGSEKFTEDDYAAKFARLEEETLNAFKPAIVDDGARSSSTKPELPNQIPAAFMDGDNNWFLTGIVSFDGATVALIENSATNEGQYLGVGQSLRQATLLSISSSGITLSGPNNLTKRLTLMDQRPVIDDNDVNAEVAPFNPLSGPIGLAERNQSSNRSTQNNGTNNERTQETR
jgi:hypothetical protein